MREKRGFTDRLYYLNLRLTWIFVGCCLLLTAFSGKLGITDLTVVREGIPSAFAELGIHTAFVVWKNKAENIKKLGGNIDGMVN